MHSADSIDTVRSIALALPGVEEGTSYGTAAFKIRGKLIARAHEEQSTLVLKMDFDTRDFLMRCHPDTYFITDHYRNYPYVLVRLDRVDPTELQAHFVRVWKEYAPKRLLAEFAERQPGLEPETPR